LALVVPLVIVARARMTRSPSKPTPYSESCDQPGDPEIGSIDTFHAALEPYGRWIRTQQYGTGSSGSPRTPWRRRPAGGLAR
jgi:hypothetical protein